MVKNFTPLENEVKNFKQENAIVMTDEEIEEKLQLQLPKLLLNPSKRCIQNILQYSKEVVQTKA